MCGYVEIIILITKDRSTGSPSFIQSTRSSGGWAITGQETTPSIPVGRYVSWGIFSAWAGSENSYIDKTLFIFVIVKHSNTYHCRGTVPWSITYFEKQLFCCIAFSASLCIQYKKLQTVICSWLSAWQNNIFHRQEQNVNRELFTKP